MDDKQKVLEKMNARVIKNYEDNEKMMVLLFAQWCINNDVDPLQLYKQAYPTQGTNKLLIDMLEETVAKEQSDPIDNETILNVLQVFGNDDLAFVVQQVIDEKKSTK